MSNRNPDASHSSESFRESKDEAATAADLLQLIDHHNCANWNLDEEFAGGVGGKADAAV